MPPHNLNLDSDPRLIDETRSTRDLDDPVALLLDLLAFGPSAPRDDSRFARARVNAYVYLRKQGIGGNPLDPLDIASVLEI